MFANDSCWGATVPEITESTSSESEQVPRREVSVGGPALEMVLMQNGELFCTVEEDTKNLPVAAPSKRSVHWQHEPWRNSPRGAASDKVVKTTDQHTATITSREKLGTVADVWRNRDPSVSDSSSSDESSEPHKPLGARDIVNVECVWMEGDDDSEPPPSRNPNSVDSHSSRPRIDPPAYRNNGVKRNIDMLPRKLSPILRKDPPASPQLERNADDGGDQHVEGDPSIDRIAEYCSSRDPPANLIDTPYNANGSLVPMEQCVDRIPKTPPKTDSSQCETATTGELSSRLSSPASSTNSPLSDSASPFDEQGDKPRSPVHNSVPGEESNSRPISPELPATRDTTNHDSRMAADVQRPTSPTESSTAATKEEAATPQVFRAVDETRDVPFDEVSAVSHNKVPEKNIEPATRPTTDKEGPTTDIESIETTPPTTDEEDVEPTADTTADTEDVPPATCPITDKDNANPSPTTDQEVEPAPRPTKDAKDDTTTQGSKESTPRNLQDLVFSKAAGKGVHNLTKLQQSKTLRFFIDKFTEDDYWPILESLYSNRCLTKLILFRNQSENGRTRTQEHLECLFYVLQSRPSTLRELHMWNFTNEDLPVLTSGLANHTTLRYVQLHFESGSLDAGLTQTLSELPKLVSLELEVTECFEIAPLIERSEQLTSLSVLCSGEPFEFKPRQIADLAKALTKNTVLSVLDLEPHICAAALQALLVALQMSNRTLDTLQFACNVDNTSKSDRLFKSIVATLEQNTQLRVLWNHCYEDWVVGEEIKCKLIQVLKRNKTIEQLHIFVEDPDFWDRKKGILDRNALPMEEQSTP